MSSPASAPQAAPSDRPWFCPTVWLMPHLTPYNLAVASVLGGITTVFAVVVVLLIIVALNFNPLGWVE